MKRIIKMLGLSLVAALVVGAFSAVSASAETPGVFECEQYTCYGKGEDTNEHIFRTKAGTVRCSTIIFEGQLAAKSSSVNSGATYSSCEAFGFIKAVISMEGCEYEFNAEEHIAKSNPVQHKGSADIVNKSGGNCSENPIKVTVSGTNCVVTVGPQNGLKNVTFTNEGSGNKRSVNVAVNITGIEYTQTGSNCSGGEGTFSDGKYNSTSEEDATAVMKGYKTSIFTEQQGVFVN